MQEAVNTNNEKVKLVSKCCEDEAGLICRNCGKDCDIELIPYDWDKRLPEIKEAGKRLKQYEDANLDMFERFDKQFDFCPTYLDGHCCLDNNRDDIKQFFRQEIENLLEEVKKGIEKIEIDDRYAFYKDEKQSPPLVFCCLCGKHHIENACKFFSKEEEQAIVDRIEKKIKIPSYDRGKRLSEIKEAGKKLKQYEDANLDMFERFDKKFLSPRTLWAQDEEGNWYSKDGVKQFFKQEIENLLKEIRKEFEAEEDWMEMHKCESRFESERRLGFNKAINYFIKIANKHGFKI